MKRTIRSALAVCFSLLLSATAFAATSDGNYYIGPQLGLGFANNNGGTNFEIGATGGMKYEQNWLFGAFFDYMSLGSANAPGFSVSNSLIFLGGEASYLLSQVAPGLHLGGKLALELNSTSVNGTGNSNTTVAIGPKVGWDYPVAPQFTVGGEFNVMFPFSSSNYTVANLLAVGKYMF